LKNDFDAVLKVARYLGRKKSIKDNTEPQLRGSLPTWR
jgi:hypothetical protein